MNVLMWILISSFILISCTPAPKTSEFSDDYALIEFAAKLEEESAATSTQPIDNNPYSPAE